MYSKSSSQENQESVVKESVKLGTDRFQKCIIIHP
jgi:hypothetical protein